LINFLKIYINDLKHLIIILLVSAIDQTRAKMTLKLASENEVGNKSCITFTNVQDRREKFILKKSNPRSEGLSLELTTAQESLNFIDVELPLERQGFAFFTLSLFFFVLIIYICYLVFINYLRLYI
jgi:hypothetical protein